MYIKIFYKLLIRAEIFIIFLEADKEKPGSSSRADIREDRHFIENLTGKTVVETTDVGTPFFRHFLLIKIFPAAFPGHVNFEFSTIYYLEY